MFASASFLGAGETPAGVDEKQNFDRQLSLNYRQSDETTETNEGRDPMVLRDRF